MKSFMMFQANGSSALHREEWKALAEELNLEIKNAIDNALVDQCRAYSEIERRTILEGVVLMVRDHNFDENFEGKLKGWSHRHAKINDMRLKTDYHYRQEQEESDGA